MLALFFSCYAFSRRAGDSTALISIDKFEDIVDPKTL